MITLHKTMISNILNGIAGTNALNNMIVYSGAMPTVNNAFSFTTAAFSSQALCSAVAITISNLNGVLRFNTTPSPVNGTATGTATWFVMFNNSLPSKCIIGSVGDQIAGTAPLQLQSTSVVSGSPINFIQFGAKLV